MKKISKYEYDFEMNKKELMKQMMETKEERRIQKENEERIIREERERKEAEERRKREEEEKQRLLKSMMLDMNEKNQLKNKLLLCLNGILLANVNGGIYQYENMLKNENIHWRNRQSLYEEMIELINQCKSTLLYLEQLINQINIAKDKLLFISLQQGYDKNMIFIKKFEKEFHDENDDEMKDDSKQIIVDENEDDEFF